MRKRSGRFELCERRCLGVTGIAGFGVLIDLPVNLFRVGGEADLAFLVDDADVLHPGLIRHRADDLVEAGAIVAHHVMRGAALDYVALALGGKQRGGFQVLPVQPNVDEAEQRRRSQRGNRSAATAAWR